MAPSDLADECRRLRELGASVGRFTAEKHEAYGSAYTGGGELVRLLTSGEALRPDLFVAAILASRIFEKLKRFFTAPKAFNESPLVDVVGHALCLAMLYGAEAPKQTDDGRAEEFLEAATGYLGLDHPALPLIRGALATVRREDPTDTIIDVAQCLREILEYARASAVYSGEGRPRRSEMGAIVRMAAATLRALGQPQPADEAFADADGTAEPHGEPDVASAVRTLRTAIELVADHATGQGARSASEHRHLGRALCKALAALGRPDPISAEFFAEPKNWFEKENLPGEAPPGPAGGGEWPGPIGGWRVPTQLGRQPCKGACVLWLGHPGFCSITRDWGGDMLPAPDPCGVTRGMGAERCAAARLHRGAHDYRPTCGARANDDDDDAAAGDPCLEWPGHEGDHYGARGLPWPNRGPAPTEAPRRPDGARGRP